MWEDFLNALANFKQNKIRSFLSLLGVIIGVTSVIVITTIGESATSNIRDSFGSSGLDLVRVNSGMKRRLRSSTLQFDEAFRQDLWDNVEHLSNIFYLNSLNGTLRFADTDVSSSLSVVEPGYLEANKVELLEGRLFSASDEVSGAQKIILGSEIASMLFSDGKGLGKRIIVDASGNRFGFEIIGILKEQTSGMETTNTSAYIPRGFYEKKIKPSPTANSIIVQVESQNYASLVASDIKTYVDTRTGIENSVMTMSMQSIIEQFDQVNGTMNLLLAGVAAISLLVGGIGIMNIMIVTVTERRKEIGIRKALGATPRAIKSQFLVESATITLLGGTIGIILGVVISFVATKNIGWSFALHWQACSISFVFSAFVGVFFGYNPASRAAKLDPVEALAAE